MKTSPFFALTIMLAGCATTPPAQLLAEKIAANLGALSAQMEQLASESKQIAERRAANIAQLHLANTRLRAEYIYDIELTKKSGDQANLKLIDTISAWAEQVETIFATTDAAESQRREEMLEATQALSTKSKALRSIAQSLASLAGEESFHDRAKFLTGFAKQLKTDVKTQLEQGSNAATEAKNELDKL